MFLYEVTIYPEGVIRGHRGIKSRTGIFPVRLFAEKVPPVPANYSNENGRTQLASGISHTWQGVEPPVWPDCGAAIPGVLLARYKAYRREPG